LEVGEVDDINKQIVYYYRNGWKLKDIAIKLNLSETAVKSRLQRIRKTQEVKRWWK
jgi:DNA-directed RNA polymerase specialized sigma24 family protein